MSLQPPRSKWAPYWPAPLLADGPVGGDEWRPAGRGVYSWYPGPGHGFLNSGTGGDENCLMAEEAAGFLAGVSTAARRHHPEPDWRTTATSVATDLCEMFLRRPWLVRAFAAHGLYGENKARHDDHGPAASSV
ncbi:hypothetical protein AB0H45_33765 [Streptomyces atroolivaceus]|uniref:Uncharacterized protein n=1 Tax=Streptomyces atroolivaceus TaxID=66869 RepID=A0ABV9VCM2_STRAZ|nr:hypothetical protein [Streptomyces atroolivaceus]